MLGLMTEGQAIQKVPGEVVFLVLGRHLTIQALVGAVVLITGYARLPYRLSGGVWTAGVAEAVAIFPEVTRGHTPTGA